MPTDTSLPADRVRFEALIGGNGAANLAACQAVQNCPMLVTEITAGLLGMDMPAGGVTFAAAAAVMMNRLANGGV